MESIDQMHVSHSKMATVVDYDMSANEFLAGLPPQVCPPALLFRLGSRKVRRYKNTWIRNSSDAMAAQQWKVVRRRRSSEGCNMSASPMARAATQGQDIPTRRVVITSEEDMPAGLQLCLCMTHSVFYLKLYFTASYIYTLPSKTKKIVRIYVYFADW